MHRPLERASRTAAENAVRRPRTHAPGLRTVLTGDTLFCGGPGATGRSYSDRPTILDSIRTRLLTLPGDTVVRSGHGEDSTIAAEAATVH